MLRDAAQRHDLLCVSEAIEVAGVSVVSKFVDIIQIGARNMQNFSLLKEVGKAKKPVLLKRGMSATVEELLMAAEYVISSGNPDVILCERGIRTFETWTRNTMDISAIPVVKARSHLPIIADPSHGTGRRDKVAPMARAAVAAGADGLIIEVHHRPDQALSDGSQSLYPDQFAALMEELKRIAWAIGRRIGAAEKPGRTATA
jgi:3-deoxy-7-phosphoheptulonate synthase